MKLSLDSPVVRAVTRFGDLVLLSILWFVGSIPMVTLGVSCSAVYAAIHRTFGRDGDGIAALEYLRAYRSNFRQSTLSFLPLGALELLLLGECFVTTGFPGACLSDRTVDCVHGGLRCPVP